ncbi:MAG: hypothetical protein CMI54_05410 [Parcubacteria group bacterium]|nr:hypothetical protein [Parcubacteria group bacterium]|tara:strand:- start:11610 stop:11858 length:249 start_codon:yes stop_codon:yes gene_type:complete
MRIVVQIKKGKGVDYLYLGDAIYIVDKKTSKWFKRESAKNKGAIEKDKILNSLQKGDTCLYPLWNLLYYDILLKDKGRELKI